jgi:predicted Ser/Thr protein kinase
MSYHPAINMGPHQPCDSYFVETQDSTALISDEERRQYESIIKRQRQERIADELSLEVRSQYLDEIVDHMGVMEVRHC